jgi:hypothetical protein
MLDGLTWAALLEQWPWFVAAAAVFLVAVGLLVVLAPKFRQEPKKASTQPVEGHWTLTGRIDFANSHSGDFVLEVEETRSITTPRGVEHRNIRWRRATLEDARMVVLAYHASRDLSMSLDFPTYTAPAAKRGGDSEALNQADDLNAVAGGREVADVGLVPPQAPT